MLTEYKDNSTVYIQELCPVNDIVDVNGINNLVGGKIHDLNGIVVIGFDEDQR